MDLDVPAPICPVVHAALSDIYSRFIRLALYRNGLPYTPPQGTVCIICWANLPRRPEPWLCETFSYNLIHDKDGAERPAWTLEGNLLTLELSPALCNSAYPGAVIHPLLVTPDGENLHLWELECRIHPALNPRGLNCGIRGVTYTDSGVLVAVSEAETAPTGKGDTSQKQGE